MNRFFVLHSLFLVIFLSFHPASVVVVVSASFVAPTKRTTLSFVHQTTTTPLLRSSSPSSLPSSFLGTTTTRSLATGGGTISTTTTCSISRQQRQRLSLMSMSSSSQSSPPSYSVGIVGATGAVGVEIRKCLEKSSLPVSNLRLFGSARSAGTVVEMTGSNNNKFGSNNIEIELFSVEAARSCDIIFLAVSGDFALEHAEQIAAGDDGAVVIDNSSAFRMNPAIPLVVPEINGETTKKSKLIANPNCTTAIGLMCIWPLIKKFGCQKIIMSTYQAASGAGQPGMDELKQGTLQYLQDDTKTPANKIFAHPLPFNVIPHIDKFQDNGYTKEEMKVTWESRKICSLPSDFPISCTAVRIPTIRAHSEMILMETNEKVDLDVAREVLKNAPGVKLVDDPSHNVYPMPLTATNQYDVEVGRLRKSLVFGDYGLEFFVCGDQLLRGAALNAVLVAEEMDKNGALQEFRHSKKQVEA